jgi:hypothetical protein
VARKRTKRDEDLSTRAKLRKRLLDVFADVEEGFIKQGSRADDQADWWNTYYCKLDGNQYYNGNSQGYVPIIRDAVNARTTRFTNQLFPRAGRFVECIDQNGEQPYALMALAEHYVRKSELRRFTPALMRNGDIEGQYNIYVDWSSRARHVVWREAEPMTTGGAEFPDVDDVETVKEDVIFDEHPVVEVLSDADVLILPITCDGVEAAIRNGGSVTILRRWGKSKIQQMIDDGEILEEEGEQLIDDMGDSAGSRAQQKNPPKAHADAAGIKAKGKFAVVYETWLELKVDGAMRMCRAYFAGGSRILGAKLNPFWCDECPLFSVPVEKIAGVAKGQSPVEPCVSLQYAANDMMNEGQDAATLSSLPIVMTDPLKNPKTNSMIFDLGAVWETSPNDTKVVSFPPLWKDSIVVVQHYTQQIFQCLGVNPSMIPQQSGSPGRKRNQAEISMEQSVDLLTTNFSVTNAEDGIFTKVVQFFMKLDAQFRNEAITVRQFGMMGLRAKMDQVSPIQMGKRYEFRWLGVESARNAAMTQQKIALINVLGGLPPQVLNGKKVDASPIVEDVVEDIVGPRRAPLVLQDMRAQLAMDPEIENELLSQGFPVMVQVLDDDAKHLQAHAQLLSAGDPHRVVAAHMMRHQQQMQAKSAAMMQQAAGQGVPGAPGGAGPGRAGLPRAGAQPGLPRPQGPPGSIHADRMPAAGATTMPRKM